MKNLLIVATICMAACQANAAYSLLWNGADVEEAWIGVGEIGTISVVSSDLTVPGPDVYFGNGILRVSQWDGDWPAVELSNFHVTAAAGSNAYTYQNAAYVNDMAVCGLTAPAVSGVWATSDYRAYAEDATGSVSLYWYPVGGGPLVVSDSLMVHVVPEPVTLGLLGLGGLFLRRRRA